MESIQNTAIAEEESACIPAMHAPTYANDISLAGRPKAAYDIPGIQVEDEAGYWTDGPNPLIHVVAVQDVLTLTGAGGKFEIKPYPTDRATLDAEILELKRMAAHRDDPLSGISDFINTAPPPFGAVYNINHSFPPVTNINQWHTRRGQDVIVATGRELARHFESETPGLSHRHALNILLFKRPDISPIRQARIWMALDIAIYSALIAAWHYKWGMGKDFSYRQRPYEYDRNQNFRVLFDDAVCNDGTFNKCARYLRPIGPVVIGPRPQGLISPGTPRHPAYPSGHSTYSSAASTILKYFFPNEAAELDKLSDNIGEARLWAGVHWRSDHDAGVLLGKAVGQRVREQLEKDCIADADFAQPMAHPDPADVIKARALARRRSDCGCSQAADGSKTCDHDTVPARPNTDDCGNTIDGSVQNFVF